ncbi:hypothetical protein SAMN02910356_01182 [Selenomonas sp. GACV-9]|uniref:hypothetical protein n=1 Tax=Selenomonas sp. GACV-9 TaxID=3158782 RepID=UPI0008E670F3|nr:hypothetical protein SAMN02910356_01182 [Selenomonas ruminantium]
MENGRQRLIEAYRNAFRLWQQRRLIEAEKLLDEFWQQSSMKSLRGMLLMAYILRDRQKYVSEVEVLEELLERFADSGEAKLLADAWSLRRSILSGWECRWSVLSLEDYRGIISNNIMIWTSP